MKNLYSALIITFFSFTVIQAQPAFFNDGDVTVEDQGLLFVDGSVEITANGSMLNDGEVEVKGNWTNDRSDGAVSASAAGQRVVKFTGINEQTINSVSGKTVFYNLDANNEAAFLGTIYSGSGILANADVTVNGTLDVASGDLIMMDHDLTIGPNGSIANYSTVELLHFTTGSLNRRVSAAKPYVYPIHRSGEGYVLASIDLSTMAPTTDVIRGRFFPQTTLGNVYAYTGNMGCTNVAGFPANQFMLLDTLIDNFGYWQFDPYTNTNYADYTGRDAGWDYDITLHVPQAKLLDFATRVGADYYKVLKIESHDMADAQYPFSTMQGFWDNSLPNSGDLCSGLVVISNYDENVGLTSTNLKSFSGFGGAGNNGGAGLPVELLYLDAYPVNNDYIEVAWATATEIDNEYFEVLRSEDGVNFTNIGDVPSLAAANNGNSSTQLNYKYADYNVVPNQVYYYRLRQHDYDGDTELTYIVSASLTAADVLVIGEFHPNPTMTGTAIEITSGKEKDMNITIYNTLGQIITARDLNVGVGKNRYEFDLSDLAAGTYHAIISFDNQVLNKKVVVTR